jgi:hypothetical protein
MEGEREIETILGKSIKVGLKFKNLREKGSVCDSVLNPSPFSSRSQGDQIL